MRIIFFGTSEFAVPGLEVLIKSSHKVALVVTQPKSRRDRGMHLKPSHVEEAAIRLGCEVKSFDDVNSKQALNILNEYHADLFVVIAFGQILSKEALAIPRLYAINLHASLLPKYRGAAPIQRAIMSGENTTGVTIMKLNAGLDKGDIMAQQEVRIRPDDDHMSLSMTLAQIGGSILVETVDNIKAGKAGFSAQDESKATYAHKLKKEEGLIKWQNSPKEIINLIRALRPWPSAYTHLSGKLVKVLEAEALPGTEGALPGSVIKADANGILVGCSRGSILIKRLQLEGKTPHPAAEFLRGKPIGPGTRFG